uniref:Uncharacterized protein n=1 Tax=Cacopsylla melanoneura TaxID=428564 RepID=A0A8D8TVA4_9HEMI
MFFNLFDPPPTPPCEPPNTNIPSGQRMWSFTILLIIKCSISILFPQGWKVYRIFRITFVILTNTHIFWPVYTRLTIKYNVRYFWEFKVGIFLQTRFGTRMMLFVR